MTSTSSRLTLFPLLLLAATWGGCAYEYAEYDDSSSLSSDAYSSENAGPPVLRYDIPANAPQGEAYVMSMGSETLTAPGGQPQMLLHLRIAVENGASEA